ncbi:MAG: cell wall metabolism sensor histidine kinase WalK [Deltaproteobacteria bacterium]|nr:cell wall metabolism sensor histidine kinase WalK [Deltaproteobacteria bacterium]
MSKDSANSSENNTKEWRGDERRSKESQMKNGRLFFFNQRPFSKLKKKLLIYFLLIAFVSLVVGLEMIWEVGEPKLLDQILANITEVRPHIELNKSELEKTFKPIRELQVRMMILLFIVATSISVTLLIFIKNIANPLDDMVLAAKELRDGNLSATVPVMSKDEIGQLGECFNDLAVNLQEVLLFVGAVDHDMTNILEKIEENRPEENNENRKLNEQLDLMAEKMDELKEMVQAFDYYNVVYDGEHVKGNEPDHILEKFKDLT